MNALAAVRRTVNLSGIELSYWEWNRGQKPLLLLHGLADCALVWASLGNYLATNYHIVAPDLRGHGDSSKPQFGYRFADLIGDVEALMQHLGWSSANVLAHSWSVKLLTILQICQVPGNHWVFLVEPEIFNQTVAEFLDRQTQN